MTPQEARLFAEALNAAADQAEMEGRDVQVTDLDQFEGLVDTALDELSAAIRRHTGG